MKPRIAMPTYPCGPPQIDHSENGGTFPLDNRVPANVLDRPSLNGHVGTIWRTNKTFCDKNGPSSRRNSRQAPIVVQCGYTKYTILKNYRVRQGYHDLGPRIIRSFPLQLQPASMFGLTKLVSSMNLPVNFQISVIRLHLWRNQSALGGA